MTGAFMIKFNKYEQEEFDSYSKEQIYEAFMSEHHSRLKLQQMLKDSDRNNAALRYDRDKFEEKYFRELVKRTIPGTTDENIDIFFSTKHKIVWVEKGYIGIQYIEGKIFIAYLYKANSYKTLKAILKFLKGTEVYYNYTEKDHYRNSSEPYNEVMRLVV
jgi:IS1 family transposase